MKLAGSAAYAEPKVAVPGSDIITSYIQLKFHFVSIVNSRSLTKNTNYRFI